jgi:hypothetical protein
MNLLVEIIGWVGSILILLAYGLNSYQRIRSDSLGFYLMNFSGGVCLIVYAIHKDASANAFINIVWVIVALIAMIRLLLRKKAT